MPSNTVEIAWALPVKVVTLGAHLEAYITLRPALDMLRLCNRFGQVSGGKGITSLPVELVEHVEKYLLEVECAKERELWDQDFKCWESRCNMMEHLTPEVIHEIYHDIDGEWNRHWEDEDCSDEETASLRSRALDLQDMRCAESDGKYKHSLRHIARQKETVESFLMCLEEDGDSEYWHDYCTARKDSWEERAGKSSKANDQGRLGKMSSILEKDFGLKIWVGHAQCETPAEFDNNIGRTTTAYLQIPSPNSSVHRSWTATHSQEREFPFRIPTEVSFALPTVLPPTPTASSLARFNRTVKALNLQVMARAQQPEVKDLSESADITKQKTKQDKENKKSTDSASTVPQLTTFSINKDETDESDMYLY